MRIGPTVAAMAVVVAFGGCHSIDGPPNVEGPTEPTGWQVLAPTGMSHHHHGQVCADRTNETGHTVRVGPADVWPHATLSLCPGGDLYLTEH